MFDLCQCDVQDKETLAIFRNNLLRWQEILKGDDHHSIFYQLEDIIWNDSIYQSFNEARRISSEIKEFGNEIPDSIIVLLDQSYSNSQIMAIRRITDAHEWKPERAVYSIHSLMAEIKSRIDLFTRENYVCYDGLPFDGNGLEWPRDHDYHRRQAAFDKLAGTISQNRKREDRVSAENIDNISKEIKQAELIREYSNKYIAHAAAKNNRTGIDARLKDLTFHYLNESIKTIITAGKRLQLIIDCHLCTSLAVPQFDQFENWDKAIINKNGKEKLYAFWTKKAAYYDELDRMQP
jgi:hypothetical protein